MSASNSFFEERSKNSFGKVG